MALKDKVRANDFDRIVGEIQTYKAMELGVGESVLDIGCGIGQYTPLFLYRFKRVVGLDPDKNYLRVARRAKYRIEYVEGWGETFKLNEKFDTISMNNILEHVDDPILLLKNCKKHLAENGRIIIQVPNAHSVTRKLGVLMGLIDNLENMTEKEINFYGHKRTYNILSLVDDCERAGLKVVGTGGILYKPLPNEILWDIYKKNNEKWRKLFIKALVEFGKDKPEDCACIYVICK